MVEEDRRAFGAALAEMFSLYGVEVTPTMLNAWWGILQPHPLAEVKVAMGLHASDPAAGRFKPLPADIIRHITETIPARRAGHAHKRAALARDQLDPLEDRLLQVENDVRLGLISQEQAVPEMTDLRAQIGAIRSRAGLDDRPRVESRNGRRLAHQLNSLQAPGGGLSQVIKALGHEG